MGGAQKGSKGMIIAKGYGQSHLVVPVKRPSLPIKVENAIAQMVCGHHCI